MWFCYAPQVAFLSLKTLTLLLFFGLLGTVLIFIFRLSHYLGFCLFNTSLLVINAVDTSLKKSTIKAAVRMRSSGLCYSTLTAGLGKEIGFAGSGVYLFFCIYLFFSHLQGKKKHVVFLLKRYTTKINLEENVVMEKSKKIYSQSKAYGFCIGSELYIITCHIHPSF